MAHSGPSTLSGQASTSTDPDDRDNDVRGNGTSLSISSSMDSQDNSSNNQCSNNSNKEKDTSNLRKGKWSVEEEIYASRIVHYFRAGLFTLPEGATLRSYLAEKLNCDPMRITKKYAGASCLGRRVYHHRDPVPNHAPTFLEVHLARVDLDKLENRFRMRLEAGEGDIPIPETASSLLTSGLPTGPNAIAQTMEMIGQLQRQQQAGLVTATLAATNDQQSLANVSQTPSTANPLQALLLNLAAAAGGNSQPFLNTGGSVQTAGSKAVPATTQQQLQPYQPFPSAAVGWPSEPPPNRFGLLASAALSVPTATVLPPSAASGLPAQLQETALSASVLAHHNDIINNTLWSIPPGTLTLSQSPSTVEVDPQQQTSKTDPDAYLAMIAKVLGPSIVQALAAAANMQNSENRGDGVTPATLPSPVQQQLNPPYVQQYLPTQVGTQQVQLQKLEAAPQQSDSFQPQQLQQKPKESTMQQRNLSSDLLNGQGQPMNKPTSAQLSSILSQLQRRQVQLQKLQQIQPQQKIQPMQQQKKQIQSTQHQQIQEMQQPPMQSIEQQMQSIQQQKQMQQIQAMQLQPVIAQDSRRPSTNQQQQKAHYPLVDQHTLAFALQLKEAYEQQLQQLKENTASGRPLRRQEGSLPNPSSGGSILSGGANASTLSAGNRQDPVTQPGQAKTDKGTAHENVIAGFLSSLRQSYEEALKEKKQDVSSEISSRSLATLVCNTGINTPMLSDFASAVALAPRLQQEHDMKRACVTTVTDSASSTQNQVESSVEDYSDWNSDKNTDLSSSEDSDKETELNKDFDSHRYSSVGKGTPRKRMKTSNGSRGSDKGESRRSSRD